MRDEIVIISGTNRKASMSYQISLLYQQLLKDMGAEAHIIDLQLLPSDFTVSALYEKAGENTEFNKYRKLMVEGNKFVFVVPEYNGSFPGVLKAFIDGLEFPGSFKDKKCALVGVSSGIQGGGLALSHLTDIFHYCGMNVLAQKPKLAHIDDHFTNGEIINELYVSLIRDQAQRLLAF